MSGIIIHADLSAIEYRLIAHETREPRLIKAFCAGEDIHANIGLLINGKLPKDKDERKVLKTLNYAEVYQVGLKKFIYLTGLPIKEAKEKYYKMKGVYPHIDEYKTELSDRLLHEEQIKLVNLFGRYRCMKASEFYGTNMGEKVRNALREAFNWIFQSSGHDVLAVWLMETMDLINDPEVLLINDVHDEFVLDVPEKKQSMVQEAIQFTSANLNTIIKNVFGVKLLVPLSAEIERGETWK